LSKNLKFFGYAFMGLL